MNRIKLAGMICLLGTACTAAPLQADTGQLPDDSVYHLDSEWRSQEGTELMLSELTGRPRLLSFVYTYCEHTCPMIVARLKMITDALSDSERGQMQVTLVSLDPERDTPSRMKAWLVEKDLESRDWLMLHGNPDEVLEFAAMLGVRYRPMGESDIAHSNMITLLDRQGVVRYQSKGLGDDPADVIEAIESTVTESE
ncbi:SCO family protein [Marinihelvus fidelis]|uniref:SCO family protein n=1 Tax=Marinihelvus fidelis TaxID=2613842 RepID=A0A5N0TCD7_9GAMM|nr:SCO family protein [Marinihelvus fidelis]KAA9132692.1 SCO family protein [Marinihelvus fidelis]